MEYHRDDTKALYGETISTIAGREPVCGTDAQTE